MGSSRVVLRDGVEVDVEGASKSRDATSGIGSEHFENNKTGLIKQAYNIVEYKSIRLQISTTL